MAQQACNRASSTGSLGQTVSIWRPAAILFCCTSFVRNGGSSLAARPGHCPTCPPDVGQARPLPPRPAPTAVVH